MAVDRKYYSELETRDPEAREKAMARTLAFFAQTLRN